MLTVFSSHGGRTCDGLSRRDFLRIGGMALGGLSLASLLNLKALVANQKIPFVRDKAVVFIYLSGGASHIETFDPKMNAPAEIRSLTGECETNIPGVSFGGTFPGLAARADKLAPVRSFSHPVGDHVAAHVHVLTGGTDPSGKGDKGFSMSSCFAKLRGTNHPTTGLPTTVFIGEQEVDGQYRNENSRAIKGSSPGMLGVSYAPFVHETATSPDKKNDRKVQQDSLATNMHLNLPADRFEDRRQLLAQIDRLNRQIDASGAISGVDQFNDQAASLVLGGAADAFDFRKESKQTREAYDTSHIQIGHKVFRPSTLGQQLLVARRLCEAGCGFITIHSAGWDMHADGNNPGIVKGMEMLGRSLDIAVSAFLDDLEARGLSDKVLLVITGDFGRTPKVNKNGGRDHWNRVCTLAFAGGGLKMGQVVGQSDASLGSPATEPIDLAAVRSTIMHTLFDVGQLRLVSGVPREIAQLIENGKPIKELH